MNLNEIEIYGNISVYVTACINVPTYDLRYIQLKRVKYFYFDSI